MKKIKLLTDTACHGADGALVEVKKDQVFEATDIAANHLIAHGQAEAVPEPPAKVKPGK